MNPWRATVWSVNLLLVGAIAYAAAITATHVLERSLRTAPAQAAAERKIIARAEKRAPPPLGAYQAVLDRNIFGARRSKATVARAAPRRAASEAAPAAPAPTPFGVTLTGTLLAGDDSYAMVIAQGERQERLYRVGDCVPAVESQPSGTCGPSQAKLAGIELDRIFVLKGGQRIPVEMGKGPPAVSARVPAREAPKNRLTRERSRVSRIVTDPQKPEGNSEEDKDQPSNEPANVFPSERVGNTYQVTVPNAEVSKAFENFSEIVAQAAAVPIIQDGEPQGFQLRRIRPGSIFERLGLKNFDLIRGVNGQSLTTADQALRLFSVFRNEREIVLDVKRRDEELTFAYTVE